MKALSIDLGGTHIGCALLDESTVTASRSIKSRAHSLTEMLPLIEETFNALLAETRTTREEYAGVAMAFPGIVDTKSNQILSTLGKYDDASGLDLAMHCECAYGLPLRLENDARMALLGEHYAGAAKGYSDAVMMILGTGIGTAAMMQGQMLRGGHGQAGCLGGHLPVNPHGRLCVCGNIGCAESEASGWALPIVAKAWPGFSNSSLAARDEIHFGHLFHDASHGDAVAKEVRDHCLHIWAMNAVALIHTYDPAVLVVGGGILRNATEQVLPFLEEYVARHAWTAWGKVKVCAAQNNEHAVLLGAIPLIRERHGN